MLIVNLIPLISAALCFPTTLYIRPWGKAALCDPFQGAEVSIVRQALETQGLLLGSHYQFACLPPASSPLAQLQQSPEAGVFGGVVIRSEEIRAGMYFSVPTFKAGLNMLRRKEEESGLWDVFSPLSVRVWVLFLITPFVVGVCNFCYYVISSNDRRAALKDLKSLEKSIGTAWSRFFYSRNDQTDSGWLGLAVLIVAARLFLLCSVCARVALEYQRSHDHMLDISEVTGERAFVPTKLRPDVAHIPFFPYPQVPGPDDDPVDLLKQHKVLVYIDDHVILCEIEDENESVEVQRQPFLAYSYGIMFGKDIDPVFLLALNTGLSLLRETTRVVDILEEAGLVRLFQPIPKPQAGLSAAWGVFIVMGVSFVLAVACSFMPFPDFFSPLWRCCLPRSAEYTLTQPESTLRTETATDLDLPPASHKAATTSVSFTLDELTHIQPSEQTEIVEERRSRGSVVGEDTIEVVRTTTLMLLLFEATSSEGIDRFARLVEKENTRKTQLSEVISDFN